MKRSAPMKRTPFKPKVRSQPGLLRTADVSGGGKFTSKNFAKTCRNSPSAMKGKPDKPRSTIKTRAPRMTPIRKSARGEECTLRLPGVCNFDVTTTVLCHENGAGAGMKSPDECGAYGCYACHMVLDGHVTRPAWLSREFVLDAFVKVNAITRLILKRKGLIK